MSSSSSSFSLLSISESSKGICSGTFISLLTSVLQKSISSFGSLTSTGILNSCRFVKEELWILGISVKFSISEFRSSDSLALFNCCVFARTVSFSLGILLHPRFCSDQGRLRCTILMPALTFCRSWVRTL